MSRICQYQDTLLKFLHTKSFIPKTTDKTKNILTELIESSDHISAILCLTILNNLCKKYNLKIHGYYLASGIDIMMIIAKVCCNRDYFNSKYGTNEIDNMITEATSWFYYCIMQNIETLRLSKNGTVNPKILQTCIEYAAKYLPLITQRQKYTSSIVMKKTDIYCFNFKNQNCITEYKKKHVLGRDILMSDIKIRYGSVCKMAICLAWILGSPKINETKDIDNLELLANDISVFMKIHDDFMNVERDMLYGDYSLNFVVNYGIKEAYCEMIDAKSEFIERSMKLNVDTKTIKEIVDLLVSNIEAVVKDVSVDIETQYDDVSTV